MEVYDAGIEIVEYDESQLTFYVKDINEVFTIDVDELKEDKIKKLYDLNIADRLIFQYEVGTDSILLYVKNNSAYISYEEPFSIKKAYKEHFDLSVTNYFEEIRLEQNGAARLVILTGDSKILANINDFVTNVPTDFSIDYDLEIVTTNKRFVTLSIASYDRFNLVLTYDLLNKEVIVKKVFLNILSKIDTLSIQLVSQNKIKIDNGHYAKEVNFNTLKKGDNKRLFNLYEVEGAKEENILSITVINNSRYYIYSRKKAVFIGRANPYKVTGHTPRLKVAMTRNNLYFFGRYTHYAFNAYNKYEYLYLQNSENKLTKFVRPFKSIKFLKRYGYFKVPINSLYVNDRIHNNFFVGNDNMIIHNLRRKHKDVKASTIKIKKFGEHLNVVRTNLHGNLTSTIVPFTEEYKMGNRIKIKIARAISVLLRLVKKKNINLYFEKKSEKADESAIRVFDKVMSEEPTNSKNYFIINEKSDHYSTIVQRYGSAIIKKYSFKQYLNIFLADYFISSELSNHLLNDRLYIDTLRSRIMKVPLIFLQHGIMFAKPVDNPMAFGFHKDKNLYNMYKSVISSELEATQFYKMGYSDDDLILTGLATFDYATLDENADKIAYMPTYRYWEEGLIYNNDIEKTSYYKSIMKIINAFEKAGMLDKLIVVPHNKFSQYIYDNMPSYKHIIESNPSLALKKAKIFITDYSSAIYDSVFRGAYPIFYWEEKDYLIDNYKAIPPVNEENAPGPIAMNVKELVSIVQNAISRGFVLEDEYMNKYLKINKFTDRKNTDRIVSFLKENKII